MATMSMKPVRLNFGKTVCCHICGRHTVLADFDLHVQTCMSKREQEQLKLNPELRTKVAFPPPIALPSEDSTNEQVSAYNNAASNQYINSLPECHKCNRHFEATRLLVHLACCRSKLSSGEATETFIRRSNLGSAVSAPVISVGLKDPNPRLICYICGSNYPILDLIEHQPQCHLAWQTITRKLDPHSPLKLPSEIQVPADPRNKHQIEAYNAEAYSSALSARPRCTGCNKAFIMSEIELHLSVCEQYLSQQSGPIPDGMAVVCFTCGDDVNVAELVEHQTTCELERSRALHKLPSSLVPASNDPFLPSVGKPTKFSQQQQIRDYSRQAKEYYDKHGAIKCTVCDKIMSLMDAETHATGCAQEHQVACHFCSGRFHVQKIEAHVQKCDHLYQQQKKRYESEFHFPSNGDYFAYPYPKAGANLLEIQRFNPRALDWFEHHRHVTCQSCKVAVLLEDLPFHRSRCFPPKTKKETEAEAAAAAQEQQAAEEENGDGVALLCYVCGREYAREGFLEHQEGCKIDFANKIKQLPEPIRESYLSTREDEYVPETPFPGPDADTTDVAMWTEEQQIRFQSNFIKCPKCTRRFYISRLRVHYRQCSDRSKDTAYNTPKKKRSGPRIPNTIAGTDSSLEHGTASTPEHGKIDDSTVPQSAPTLKSSIPGPANSRRKPRTSNKKYAPSHANGGPGARVRAKGAVRSTVSDTGERHGVLGDTESDEPLRPFPSLNDENTIQQGTANKHKGNKGGKSNSSSANVHPQQNRSDLSMDERFRMLEEQVQAKSKQIDEMKSEQDIILKNLTESEQRSRELESKVKAMEIESGGGGKKGKKGKKNGHKEAWGENEGEAGAKKKKSAACSIL